MQRFKVSKVEAARRQLEVAVRLYFSNADPLAIHTLACASDEILGTLAKRLGVGPRLRDQFIAIFTAKGKKQVIKAMTEAQNFLKHGASDPYKVLDFNPTETEFVLYDACTTYKGITGETNPFFWLFGSWFLMIHGELMLEPKMVDEMKNQAAAAWGKTPSRVEFFAEMLPFAMKLGATE